MPISMAVASFFTLWWIVLFAVLPFGVRSQEEAGEIVPGTDPGAPALPHMGWKVFWTTIVTTVLFAGLLFYTGLQY